VGRNRKRNRTSDVLTQLTRIIAQLAALVPKPRVDPTHYHGFFASNSKHRVRVPLAKQKEAEGPYRVDLGYEGIGRSRFCCEAVNVTPQAVFHRGDYLSVRPTADNGDQ
jgi:hypothetical protein